MKRSAAFCFAFAIGICVSIAAPARGQDPEADDAARKLAVKLLDEGSTTFNTCDARAMAASYTDDAIVFFQSHDENGLSVKEHDGREEIEQFYRDLFKDRTSANSKNHVEYARRLAPDLLVVAGTFEPGLDAANPISVSFYQVRTRQGDKWLISSLRFFYIAKKDQ